MVMRTHSRHNINPIKPAINLKALYSPTAYTPVLVHKHEYVLLIRDLLTYICCRSLLGLFQTEEQMWQWVRYQHIAVIPFPWKQSTIHTVSKRLLSC